MMVADLTSKDLGNFADVVAMLQTDAPGLDVKRQVFEKLVELTRADIGSSNFMETGERVNFLHNFDPASGPIYDKHFRARDWVTRSLSQQPNAALVSSVIPYKDFYETPVYNDFLKPYGLHHGLHLTIRDGDRIVSDFKLWREAGSPDFTQREIAILDCLQSHMRRAFVPPPQPQDALTSREHEVVNLIGRGFRDKDIADLLEIKFSTVRTHINRALEKTGSSNRAELAALVRA